MEWNQLQSFTFRFQWLELNVLILNVLLLSTDHNASWRGGGGKSTGIRKRDIQETYSNISDYRSRWHSYPLAFWYLGLLVIFSPCYDDCVSKQGISEKGNMKLSALFDADQKQNPNGSR